MPIKTFGAKFINTVADATAGGAVSLLLTATTSPGLAAAAMGALAIGLLTQAFVQSKGEQEAQREGAAALRQMIEKEGNLAAALRRIAAEQDAGQIFAAEQATQMLAVIEAGHSTVEHALTRQESLLIHVGQWLSDWCEKNSLSQGQFIASLEGKVDQLLHLSMEDRQERRQTATENAAQHSDIHRKLDDLGQKIASIPPPPPDAFAHIEKAVEHLKKRSFDIASYILSDLRQRQWPALSAHQRFRVLANLGHVAERKDGDYKLAARLYLEAADADPTHERAKALQAIAYMNLGDRARAHGLAEQAVIAAPNTALPYAVRVRTIPDEVLYSEVEAGVPEHLREDAELAFALAIRAMLQGKIESRGPSSAELRVAEKYVRTALAADPMPMFQAHLGMILVELERLRAIGQTFDIVVKDPAPLRASIEMLTMALDGYGKQPDPELHGRIHLARGLAHSLLRDTAKANEDFEEAFGAAPDDPEIILQRSLVLHDRQDPDAAINLLRLNVSDAMSKRSRLMLCRMLARRNDPGDREESVELLRSAIPTLVEAQMLIRIQTVDTLVKLLGECGDHEGALAAIRSVAADAIDPAALKAITADALHIAGKSEAAVEMIAAAACAVQVESDAEVKFYVAAAAQDLGRHDLAFPLLNDLVPDDRVVPETPRLLAAAEALGEDDFAITFCRRLRANGILDWRFVGHEAHLLQEYNATDRAVAILQEFLAAKANDSGAKLARVLLSDIGIQAGRSELVVTDFNLLPRVEEVSAAWGEGTVRVMRQSDPTAAIHYAYKLVRRFFDRPEAHRALIASMTPNGPPLIELPAHAVVDNDSAVRFRERGRLEDEWWVIETEQNPDVARREIAPGHATAQLLRDKNAGGGLGSEFYIDRNNIQDRIGDVLEILDKHVYRLRDCAERYRERFPAEPFFILMVRAVKPDGTPDVEPILRAIEQRDQVVREAEAEWRIRHLPLASLATAVGRPVTAVISHLASRRGDRQWCCIGSVEELETASTAVARAEALVLEPTALSALFLSGAYKSIKRDPLALIASAGAVAEFQRLCDDHRPTPELIKGRFGIVDGQRVMSGLDPEVERRAAEELEHFLKWVRETVRVEDGSGLAKVAAATRNRLLENVGRPTAESLVLAEITGRVLWTDDVWLALGARAANMRSTSAWSQVVLSDLVLRGQADDTATDTMAAWLIRAEFFFLRVSADEVVRAARQSEWNTSVEPLRTMLGVFGVAETEPFGLYFFAATVLKHVLKHAPDSIKGAEVFGGILDRLSLVPSGPYIIGRLGSERVSVFWPDASAMLAADLAMRRWAIRRNWERGVKTG